MRRNQLYPALLAIIICIASPALSQTKPVIQGTVMDSLAGKPLTYATVELFRKIELTQPVRSAFTNESGKFSLPADSGMYTLIITHTGYGEKKLDVTVESVPVELHAIMLSKVPAGMEGIVVTARKPLIEQSDDKIIFNVENDPATKTESAIDILRKTPFVSVDGDNNIQVNGQSNFKVLLNGRETAMFAQNVKEALKGFPGALITKIEVITTPSAKYDAEGVGGIINIITRKKVVGYNGSIHNYYSSNGWFNTNTNFSAKFGKIGFTMYYGAGGGRNVKGQSRMETVPLVAAPFTRRELFGTRTMNNFWNFGNAELSWEYDSLNTISFYGNISGGNNRHVLNQEVTTAYTAGDSISRYTLNSRNEYPTKSAGADYIRKFTSNKEREFSIRFNGEFGNSNTFLNSFMDYEVRDDRYMINNSEAGNTQYTAQSDYVHPLSSTTKLESGVKGIFRQATSDFHSLLKTNAADEYKINPENTDEFRYNQDVLSAYSTYSFKVNKTTFRLGARLEHTFVSGNFITAKTSVKQEYTNVLPNIQSSTKFSNSFSMVVTLSQRLQRPFIWNLNPFKNNNDPLFVSYGNPDLEAQTIHSLSLQTRYNKNGTFAGITFSGTYSDNMIVQYATFDPATGVTTTTSGNLGREFGLSANGNVNTKINKDWSVFLNGNVRFNRVQNKADASQSNEGISGNANLNTNYSFSKRFNASGYAGFFRAPVTIQSSYPFNLWYGINVGYKFFNEKLNISAGMANFLQKRRDWKLVTTDPAFRYTSTSTMPFAAYSVSISWTFGKLTENVSRKKGVSNDDLLGNGQSSN